MSAVDHIAKRRHPPLGIATQPDGSHGLAIDHGGLLTRPQIRKRLTALCSSDPIRHAAAGAALVEAKHQARPFRRSAMDERINAKRPVGADEPRLDPFNKVEARPPDQRAIAEHPEVVGGLIEIPVHAWTPSVGKNAVEMKILAAKWSGRNSTSSKGRIRQLVASASGRLTPGPRVEWHGSLVYDRSVVPYVHFPQRRRWPVFLPFGFVIVLAALWTGFWFFASARAETTLAGWREREAKAGRVYSCDKQSVGGYPFRFEVRCAEPVAELRGDPPVALKAKDLLAAVQVYDPGLVVGEIKGPLTIGEPGKPASYVANWTLGQSSVRGTPEAPERASFVFVTPTVDRIAEGGNVNVFNAERAEVHGRLAAGSVTDHPVIDLAVLLQGASAQELHPAAKVPSDVDIVAVLRGLKDFSPKPWPDRFREVQAANGEIEIVKARIQQEDVIAVGSGKLGLSPNGRLDGRLQLTVVTLIRCSRNSISIASCRKVRWPRRSARSTRSCPALAILRAKTRRT